MLSFEDLKIGREYTIDELVESDYSDANVIARVICDLEPHVNRGNLSRLFMVTTTGIGYEHFVDIPAGPRKEDIKVVYKRVK